MRTGTEDVLSEDWPSAFTFASSVWIRPLPRSTGSGDERYRVPDASTARFTGGPVIRCA